MANMKLSILVLSLSCVYAQNECYYAANERAGSAIVPCGGSGSYSACCQIGDLCLSDSSCWNPVHNVTYLYGCSDPSYTDSSCPWKCGPSFNTGKYVGLDYCYNTTQNEWSCTHPPSNSDAIESFPAQECVDDSIIAFAGPSSLQPILSLPTDVGGGTVWFSEINPTSYTLVAGYTPASTVILQHASTPTTVEQVSSSSSPSPTSTSTTTTSSSSSIPPTTSSSSIPPSTSSTSMLLTPTSSSSPASTAAASASASNAAPLVADNGSGGLSTGAKIGIGVGVGLGVLALLALVAFILFRRRRRRTHHAVPQTEAADEKKPRPPSELPADVKLDQSPNQRYERYTGSSTASNWGSPAPTYSTDQTTTSATLGRDQRHELSAESRF